MSEDETAIEERAAVARLKAGSIDGLEALVRLHQAGALKVAYAITHDVADAEDVVADSFLRAYERIGGFDGGRPFGPWFLQIVVRSAIRTARRGTFLDRLRRHAPDPPIVSPDPASSAEGRELAALVLEAVTRLSPKLRAALVLRYYLELDQREIAAILRCPEGTVKRRLHDARLKMRGLLAGRLAKEVR